MTKKPQISKDAADKLVKNIRRETRQTYSAEEKIRIVLAGLRGEESISMLAVGKGLARACITVGRRNSLRLASVGSRVTPRVRPRHLG